MLRQPNAPMDATGVGRRRKRNNLVEFEYERVDDNSDADDDHGDVLKNMRAQNFFNNPLSAFLATLSSIVFWCIYWMAKALIAIAGIFIIIAFICPHKCIELFNHFMDQHKLEEKFREEL
ncbi:uncharacterized protein LOC129247449 [Anastrepha obliqua]|uniref:uncharacterized protein LOC128865236 n=1 Tax=Anastrepha ludens TaxID=28586 RepID=UPI0023B00AFD|nr:uncharacterized protein LOC128865236 [Anastrepha ludens]XP_054742554.1 uncharacterized protein LOC129247449 [Anastrepha obliqua]